MEEKFLEPGNRGRNVPSACDLYMDVRLTSRYQVMDVFAGLVAATF